MLKRFRSVHPIGKAFLCEGQRYVLIDVRQLVRKDGQPTVVLSWQSHCADCGKPFVTTSGLTISNVNRRCDVHKTPGKPVSGKYNPYYNRRKRHG
jgi:hypothetical protein